jgi:hypothetical protein
MKSVISLTWTILTDSQPVVSVCASTAEATLGEVPAAALNQSLEPAVVSEDFGPCKFRARTTAGEAYPIASYRARSCLFFTEGL